MCVAAKLSTMSNSDVSGPDGCLVNSYRLICRNEKGHGNSSFLLSGVAFLRCSDLKKACRKAMP